MSHMRKSDVLKHFKTATAAARAIGITKSAVSQWADIIPEDKAYRYQDVTRGKLKVDRSLYSWSSKANAAA
jgi:DNA-binding transcriptional regulator YdaS (Cro superfamily)